MLADVGFRLLSVLINVLFASQAFDLRLADALNAAWNVVDSYGDNGSVQTRSFDCHQLAALGMALIVADRADSRHDLDSVAGNVIIGARLNRARIIHGVACTAEKCSYFSSRVADVGLNRAWDIVHVVGG